MSAIPPSVDPIALLQELGLQVQEEKGDEIYCRCPMHMKRVGRPDHDASWSVNIDTGEHYCFSCGFGGTIWWLIAYNFEWLDNNGQPDIQRAKKWIQKRAGESFDIVKMVRKTSESFVRVTRRKTMDESRLALFIDPPDEALQDRALDRASVKHYGVRYSTEYEAWVLPIRDPDNARLWGWQLKGYGIDNHVFRNQPTGVRKSETLFGYSKLEGTAILVESPLDAVRLHSLGFTGATSSYGATWTEKQLSLICDKADRLIVALDNDNPGRKAALAIMGRDITGKRIEDGKDWTRRIDTAFFEYTTDHKDVGEMDAADVFKGLSHARSSVRGAKAVL